VYPDPEIVSEAARREAVATEATRRQQQKARADALDGVGKFTLIFWIAVFVIWFVFYTQGQHKPTEQESRAEQACAVIKSSPEYQVSSPGGDFRRNADEVCDAFRRNAVRSRQQ